jgi:hypothetical protein
MFLVDADPSDIGRWEFSELILYQKEPGFNGIG